MDRNKSDKAKRSRQIDLAVASKSSGRRRQNAGRLQADQSLRKDLPQRQQTGESKVGEEEEDDEEVDEDE